MHCLSIIESAYEPTADDVEGRLLPFVDNYTFDYYQLGEWVDGCKHTFKGDELPDRVRPPYFFITADDVLYKNGIDWSDPHIPDIERFENVSDWLDFVRSNFEPNHKRLFADAFVVQPDRYYTVFDVHV